MISEHVPDVKIFDEEKDLAQTVVRLAIGRIVEGLKNHEVFHLALTGGSLGIRVAEGLVSAWNEEPGKYSGLHVWWSDERFVPEMSEERNALPVIAKLDDDSLVHIHQALPSDSHVNVETAAKRYSADLFGIDMDLVILGLGPDGHVASLFPGQWHENEERAAISVSDSPKPPSQRVSFSMSKINSSRAIWLIVNGAGKREAVAKIVARDVSIPATYVHGREETLLFVDRAALLSE